jgi:type IV secretory pathway TraG/TraD family ATPase VirD4
MLYENINKIATSKFGTKKDLKRLLGNDGIILSKHYQLNFNSSLEHVLILGPTGSKKTTGVYLPNLLDNKLPLSIFFRREFLTNGTQLSTPFYPLYS